MNGNCRNCGRPVADIKGYIFEEHTVECNDLAKWQQMELYGECFFETVKGENGLTTTKFLDPITQGVK